MITREKMNHGEGELVEENPEIGSRKRTSQSEKMASEEGLSHDEKEFRKTFFAMSEMMKVLYDDYLERKRPILGESSKVKSEEGEDPPKTPPSPPSSPSTSSSSSSSSKSTARKHSHKHKHDMPLLKLDVKFELPMYDGEVNAERLDNWVRQMEVYCSVQQIKDEATQIKLASLRLAGTTLIWWQRKLQNGTQQVGNVFPSWQVFVSALRKQFYPLGYKEKALIEWKGLKLRKGQTVQEYIDEFRKMALMLDIPLHTQETLMKYIGGLPAHIRNTVFMFGPTNLDEVFVQATYIEAGKTRVGVSGESSSRKEDKRKWNGKKENSVARKEEKLSCKHCKKEGHDDDHCWKLHPEKRPKWFKERKGRQTVATTSRPTDLGSDSGDESKITAVGLTGKIGDGFDSRSKLFHIRVIMRHTKVDTLIDSGSQSNLISEEVVKQLGLNTQMHHKPYSLKWISNNHKLHITKQCTLKFAISSKFVDEVTCDVVPLNECGMVLGSPYLYDHKAIFYREHNQYHLIKAGKEYVVHAHHLKENQSLQTMEQLRKAAHARNTPIIVPNQAIDLKQEHEMIVEWKFNHTLLQDKLMSCKYYKHISSFAVIFLMLSLLMLSTWMIVASVRCDRVQVANNMLSVVMVVLQLILMRQVHRTEFKDREQVGWPIPHLMTG
jgi:hypothetical protein